MAAALMIVGGCAIIPSGFMLAMDMLLIAPPCQALVLPTIGLLVGVAMLLVGFYRIRHL